ncbi:MAG: hypothetical protein DBW85_05785 [Synechococcus sp. MED-G71]|nr:MAG: hypothetical protein DBW85_05785 [Synechococcus sp. MED-G71]
MFRTFSADADAGLNAWLCWPETLGAAIERAVTIPDAASLQQLKALQRQRHAAGLINAAKRSCRSTLQRRGSIGFDEAQQDLLQSCILMNTLLERLQQQTLDRLQQERATITRHQLRALIQDLLQYNSSAA